MPATTTTTWGIDRSGRLLGPGALQVDLARCPDAWSDTTGIDAQHIVLGQTAPLSGPNAPPFTALIAAYDAYIAQINADGGINGRQIEIRREDNEYTPAASGPAGQRLIDQGVFAVINDINSEQALAVAPVANQACVPQLFAYGTHPGLHDPTGLPWSTALGPSLTVEAMIWAAHIAETHPNGATIALVTIDNDFGRPFETAVPAAIADKPGLRMVGTYRHGLNGADVTDRITEALATNPDVLILATAGIGTCADAIRHVAENGTQPARYVSTGCGDPSILNSGHSDGWHKISSPDYPTNLEHAAIPSLVQYRNAMATAGIDPYSFPAYITYFGLHTVLETLRRADKLPGGLTRTNTLIATWSLQLSHPALRPSVNLQLNGTTDAHAIEGAELLRFTPTGRTPIKTYDLNGRTPNCPWNPTTSQCTPT